MTLGGPPAPRHRPAWAPLPVQPWRAGRSQADGAAQRRLHGHVRRRHVQLAALFAALSLRGHGLVGLVRGLLLASAGLAFLGLLGVPLADMNVRNIGTLGYAVLFPVATAFAAVVFRRAEQSADCFEH